MKELEHILKAIEHIETTHKQQGLTDFNRGVLWICGELKKTVKEARHYAQEPTVGELLSYGVFKGDFMLVGSCSGKVRYRSWEKKIDDTVKAFRVSGKLYGADPERCTKGHESWDQLELEPDVRMSEYNFGGRPTRKLVPYTVVHVHDYELTQKEKKNNPSK